MSFIKEESNEYNATKYYNLDSIQTGVDALNWLSAVREINGFFTKYISFSDLLNRSDEGSGDIQFESQVSLEELKQGLQNRRVDMISITGRFLEKPVVIGVDMETHEAYLTIRKEQPADTQRIESLLHLI